MGPTAGMSFKPIHLADALRSSAVGLWFEVHAENYMVPGGPRLSTLETLRREHPLSIHGVGLSLAGADRPDVRHLRALKEVCERFDPFLISEHLAWSRSGQTYFPDLLPFPRTDEALSCIARNIEITQDTLQRQILVENPALYLPLQGHTWDEAGFLAELVKRTGCHILLDVANVRVSANNLGYDSFAYIDAIPVGAVGEIHLAGYSYDPEFGELLLIDSHDRPVSEAVWALYVHALQRFGSTPTLVERDGDIPPFDMLLTERDRAATMMRTAAKAQANV